MRDRDKYFFRNESPDALASPAAVPALCQNCASTVSAMCQPLGGRRRVLECPAIAADLLRPNPPLLLRKPVREEKLASDSGFRMSDLHRGLCA